MSRGLLVGGGIIAVLFVSFVTAACGFFVGRASVDTSVQAASDSSGSGESGQAEQPQSGEGEVESQAENSGLSVGDTAEVNGVQITITEAFRTQGEDVDIDYLPGQDYTHLVVRIRVQNGSEEPVSVSPGSEFLAFSESGEDLDATSLIRQLDSGAPREDQELYGDVRPGADINGTIAFIAREDEAVIIEYLSDFLETADASWTIGAVEELPEQEFISNY